MWAAPGDHAARDDRLCLEGNRSLRTQQLAFVARRIKRSSGQRGGLVTDGRDSCASLSPTPQGKARAPEQGEAGRSGNRFTAKLEHLVADARVE